MRIRKRIWTIPHQSSTGIAGLYPDIFMITEYIRRNGIFAFFGKKSSPLKNYRKFVNWFKNENFKCENYNLHNENTKNMKNGLWPVKKSVFLLDISSCQANLNKIWFIFLKIEPLKLQKNDSVMKKKNNTEEFSAKATDILKLLRQNWKKN